MSFDADKYIEIQKKKILDKVEKSGRLYLEIEWDVVKNVQAAEIIKNFPPDMTKRIFHEMNDKFDIFFCVNADDIVKDTNFVMQDVSYAEYLETRLMVIERNFGVKPVIVINNIDISNMFDLVLNFERKFQKKQYRVFERYKISAYPFNIIAMLGEKGFGGDDHIPVFKNLVLVMWANSNCGKFSTCIGQICLDHEIGIKSWYAKFSVLPVYDLPLDHPANLAYQEDIKKHGLTLELDEKYKQKYGKDFVITSKDQECFEILQKLEKHTDISFGYDCAGEFIV